MSILFDANQRPLTAACCHGHIFQVLLYPGNQVAIGRLLPDQTAFQPKLPKGATIEEVLAEWERTPAPTYEYRALAFIRTDDAGNLFIDE
jgi:hypothetical protein